MEASFRTCPYFWVPTFQTLVNSPSTIRCDPLRCEEWKLDAGCAHSADNPQRYCSNLMLGKPTTTSINSIQESLWILLNPFESVYLGVSWMGQKDSQHLRLLGTQKKGWSQRRFVMGRAIAMAWLHHILWETLAMVNMMINIKFEGQDFWVNFEFISSFLFF
jgi:hypothetical protein